ncbi:MAG: hypothetical protein Q9169_006749 [Polycauliona sp. 2 TL-2023]
MTPKKPKTHQRHQSAHLQPSDQYDSDILLPPTQEIPPQRTNAELNLSVLQRHLPSTTSIVCVAPYAVVYIFTSSPQTGPAWEKSGIEGTLFVCQQSAAAAGGAERYSVVILNRKGLNDFICPLSGDIDYEAGYIILRSTDDGAEENIWGLWIFEEDEGSSTAGMREVNAKIIRECAARAANNIASVGVSAMRIDREGNSYPYLLLERTASTIKNHLQRPRSLRDGPNNIGILKPPACGRTAVEARGGGHDAAEIEVVASSKAEVRIVSPAILLEAQVGFI